MDIHEIRKQNLQKLIKDQFGGVKKRLAEKCGWQPIVISTLSSDKPSSFKPMGAARARAIEKIAGLPEGYMDKEHTEPKIALLKRAEIDDFLNTTTGHRTMIPAISVPDKLRSSRVFAIIEDMDGLEPRINRGDYVFVSSNLPLKPETNSMFWVNGTALIGLIKKTPSGLILTFYSRSPGWEPVKVEESDYIGRVIAIDPAWAREQRES